MKYAFLFVYLSAQSGLQSLPTVFFDTAEDCQAFQAFQEYRHGEDFIVLSGCVLDKDRSKFGLRVPRKG